MFRESFPPLLLCTEFFRNREERHDRVALDVVGLHFIENLNGIGESFRYVLEDIVHLLTRLKPFLLTVTHSGRVIKVLAGGKA